MQQFGLVALELTRQRSAWLHGPGLRDSRLGAPSPGTARRSRLMAAYRTRRDTKVESLRGLPIFSGLRDCDLKKVARLVDIVELPAGHTFIREGASGREFFVVATGSVRVSQNGRQLAQLGPGSWVGEIALMSATPRTATVTTSTPAQLFVTTERGFRQLVETWRSVAGRLEQGLAERTRPLAQ